MLVAWLATGITSRGQAQEGAQWQTIFGDPRQTCHIAFRSWPRDGKPNDEGRMQFWYDIQNGCPNTVRVQVLQTDGDSRDFLSVPAGRTTRSWTVARDVVGAKVVSYDNPGRDLTEVEVERTQLQNAVLNVGQWESELRSAALRMHALTKGAPLQTFGAVLRDYSRSLAHAQQKLIELQATMNATLQGSVSISDALERLRSFEHVMNSVDQNHSRLPLRLRSDLASVRSTTENRKRPNPGTGGRLSSQSMAHLLELVRAGDAATLRTLLATGADPNSRDPTYGYSLLMYAVRGGHNAVSTLLIEQGADVNAVANDGYTALMFAAVGGNQPAAQMLLRHGASVNTRHQGGSTALGLVGTGNPRMADLLKREGGRM